MIDDLFPFRIQRSSWELKMQMIHTSMGLCDLLWIRRVGLE